MILSTLLFSALCFISHVVNASPLEPRGGDDFVPKFLQALNDAGATTASKLYKNFLAKKDSQSFTNTLKGGQVTLLVPENNAFDSNNPSMGDDNVFSYNLLFGNIANGFATPGSQISRRAPNQNRLAGKSYFTSPGLVKPGSKRGNDFSSNQVQFSNQFVSGGRKRWDPIITFDRPIGSSKVTKTSSFRGIAILIIDAVLSIPTTVSDLLCKPLVDSSPNGFTKFGSSLQRAGQLERVDNGTRITLFAPSDEAFNGVDVDNMSDDDLASIMKNHFAFGSVDYTADFPFISKITMESGNQVNLVSENGVTSVQCGSRKAQVIRPDIPASNGVVHVINSVLKCD